MLKVSRLGGFISMMQQAISQGAAGPDWPSVIAATLFLYLWVLRGILTYYPRDLSSR